MNSTKLQSELQSFSNPAKAKLLQRFFKTGKGEYGEGDVFLGLTVPVTRSIAKKYTNLDLSEIKKLLSSKIHEERLCTLLILVAKFQKATEKEKLQIYNFYIQNARQINNWDLVDLSSHEIVGQYLLANPKEIKILEKLARSDNLWEKRISMVSTYAFIRNKEFDKTFRICEILLKDKHDLIHKACGWMLREVGKRASEEKLIEFLEKNANKMPRTMLRYSIERLPEQKRAYFLAIKLTA